MDEVTRSCRVATSSLTAAPLTCQGSADGGAQQAPSVARSSTDADSVAEAKAQAVQLQLQQQVGGGDWHTLATTLHAMLAAFCLMHYWKAWLPLAVVV